MRQQLRENFKNPSAWYHSFPFWSWNGVMEEEEIIRQIREMKEAGVGGFFIHSREGLETEYMGEQWMRCVKAAVAEAKKLGMYAWLYDEDRWPSGSAGGKVTSLGDAYRCKGLTLEVLAGTSLADLFEAEISQKAGFTDDQNGILAAYAAVVSGDDMYACRRIPLEKSGKKAEWLKEEELREGETLLAVRLEVSAPSGWFNNQAPPDNLNPDCVRKFIEETHEKYKALVGEEFGKTIPGIFTDEPSLHDRHAYFGENKSWIPWTYGYGAYFQDIFGYDFLDVMPWLFFNGEKSQKARHDYWKCNAKRYGEAYFQTLGEWCEQNHLMFTGHFLQEDKLGLGARVNGAVMPNYQYQQVPGIDMLCERTTEFMTVKQCASAAHQTGKKQVITETYGCSGWEFSFEGQKWIGDWQFILGVNRRCQHLNLYTLRGCRKRDYPPSFNYNNTWWKENKWVDDYFARFSTVLEEGEVVRNLLLLHPMSTVWGRLGCSPYGNPVRRNERDVPELNQYGDAYNALIERLVREHLDIDLGDELLIDQYGEARNGSFIVGQAGYKAVIIPPHMENLETGTYQKLLDFLDQGGSVYCVKPCPVCLDGRTETAAEKPDSYDDAAMDVVSGLKLQKLLEYDNFVCVEDEDALLRALSPYRMVSIEDGCGRQLTDVLYQLRKTEDGYVLCLVNNSREREADAVVRLPFHGSVEKMDLLTGEITSVTALMGVDGMKIPLHLGKTGSAVCYIREYRTKKTAIREAASYETDHLNVLPLDRCRYRVDGGALSEEKEVWQAQMEIRQSFAMRQIRYNDEAEQRYKWIYQPHPENGHLVELFFSFESEENMTEVSLVLERMKEFSVALNGVPCEMKKTGWFLDREFDTLSLKPGVVKGKNSLMLSCYYRNDMELEVIYLLGDFGVDCDRRLIRKPENLPFGNWTEHGFKHYAGGITWKFSYERSESESETWLRLPPVRAIAAELRVNEHIIPLPWDFAEDISVGAYMRAGTNEISLRLIGSPRNMLGPFHLKEKPLNTNSSSFCPGPEEYCGEYLLTPFGLMGEIRMTAIDTRKQGDQDA